MKITREQGQTIVYNRLIPFPGFLYINLFGILFVRGNGRIRLTNRDILHERVHTKQQKELLYIFFYVWYLIEWLIRLFQYKFDLYAAYSNISFEKEAYYIQYEKPLNALDYRKRYGFIRYL